MRRARRIVTPRPRRRARIADRSSRRGEPRYRTMGSAPTAGPRTGRRTWRRVGSRVGTAGTSTLRTPIVASSSRPHFAPRRRNRVRWHGNRPMGPRICPNRHRVKWLSASWKVMNQCCQSSPHVRITAAGAGAPITYVSARRGHCRPTTSLRYTHGLPGGGLTWSAIRTVRSSTNMEPRPSSTSRRD